MAMYKVKISASFKVELEGTTEEDAINKAKQGYDLGKELANNISINVKKS